MQAGAGEIPCHQRKLKGLLGVIGMVVLIALLVVIYYWMFFNLEPNEELTLWGTLLKVLLPLSMGILTLMTMVGAVSLAQTDPFLIVKKDGLWLRDYGGFVPYGQFHIGWEETENWGTFLAIKLRSHDKQMERASLLGRIDAWTKSLMDIPPLGFNKGSTTPDAEEILQLVLDRQVAAESSARASGRLGMPVDPHQRRPARERGAGAGSGRQIRPSGSGRQIRPAGERTAAVQRGEGAETLDNAPEAVLILLPFAGDPSKAQVQAAADALGVIAYEARRSLTGGIPRLVRGGGAEEISAAAKLLLDVEVPCLCAEPGLLADPGVFRVRKIERAEGGLRCTGPDGERRIDPKVPALLVVACYHFVGRGRLSVGVKGTSKREGDERARMLVGHLYTADDPVPLAIHEPDIGEFSVLQKRRESSNHQNYLNLLDMISAPAGTDRIDLLRDRQDVIVSLALGKFGIKKPLEKPGRRPSPTTGGSLAPESNAHTVDVLSRVLYLDWKAARANG